MINYYKDDIHTITKIKDFDKLEYRKIKGYIHFFDDFLTEKGEFTASVYKKESKKGFAHIRNTSQGWRVSISRSLSYKVQVKYFDMLDEAIDYIDLFFKDKLIID